MTMGQYQASKGLKLHWRYDLCNLFMALVAVWLMTHSVSQRRAV